MPSWNAMPSEEEKQEHRASEEIIRDKVGDVEIITALRENDGRCYLQTMIFGGPLDGTMDDSVSFVDDPRHEAMHVLRTVVRALNVHQQFVHDVECEGDNPRSPFLIPDRGSVSGLHSKR